MNLISFLLSSPAEALIQNSAELARTEFLAHRDELKLKLAELDNRLEVLQKQLTLSLKQFGLEATAELQLIYADVRDKQRIVSNTLRQMKPAHYEIDHLIKNKSRILQRILKECELWRAKEWKQVEKIPDLPKPLTPFNEPCKKYSLMFLLYVTIPWYYKTDGQSKRDRTKQKASDTSGIRYQIPGAA